MKHRQDGRPVRSHHHRKVDGHLHMCPRQKPCRWCEPVTFRVLTPAHGDLRRWLEDHAATHVPWTLGPPTSTMELDQ